MAKKRKTSKKRTAKKTKKIGTVPEKQRKSKSSSSIMEKTMGNKMIALGIVLIIVAALIIIGTSVLSDDFEKRIDEKQEGSSGQQALAGTGDKVKVEFYVMSQCPYGTQVEDAIAPVLDKVGGQVDFHLDYIVSENADGTFRSLHGQKEVDGNIVQLCAMEIHPNKYMDMITCMNKNAGAIPNNWEKCAEGMDKEAIRACKDGEQGKQLLRESLSKAQQRGATGSPTIYIADKMYQGARDETSFMRAVCQHIDHAECESVPACVRDADCTEETDKIGKCIDPGMKNARCVYEEDAAVEMIVLNDGSCNTCDPTQVIAATKNYFKNLDVTHVDASTEEGKQLIEEHGLQKAPAFLFTNSIKDTYAYKSSAQLQGAFMTSGEGYRLKDQAVGAEHWLDDKKREEFLQGIGVEKGDNRPQIDFFVMSYCPYGNQAEENIEPVYEAMKDVADFNPRYVWYSNYQGGGPQFCLDEESKYCSMHGIQEANQNIRELCAKEEYGMDMWFDFAIEMNNKCNYQNADECWKGVADDLGIDQDKITSCFDTRKLEFAAEDLDIGTKLGARGSPSIYVDGIASSARSPLAYQQALCQAYDEAPEECADAVTDQGTEAAQGGCGV